MIYTCLPGSSVFTFIGILLEDIDNDLLGQHSVKRADEMSDLITIIC